MRLSRLTTKLFLETALVTLVALGTLGGLAVTMSQARLRERIAAHNRTTAVLAARAVDRYVAGATEIVQEASGRPKLNAEVSGANWAEVSRVLDNFLRHFTQFDYVLVVDARGVMRARVPHSDTVGQDFSFRDFFRERWPRVVCSSPLSTPHGQPDARWSRSRCRSSTAPERSAVSWLARCRSNG